MTEKKFNPGNQLAELHSQQSAGSDHDLRNKSILVDMTEPSQELGLLQQLVSAIERIDDKLEKIVAGQPLEKVPELEDKPAFNFGTRKTTSAGSEPIPFDRNQRLSLPDSRLIRLIIEQRRLRAKFFDEDLFGDPAWDMLLDLAVARAEHKRVSVTSLCIASAVPPTTALRWIGQMVEMGLFERIEDEADRRRAFIALSDKAARLLARYFLEINEQPHQRITAI